MAICGVVAAESLLTYDPVRSGGKQHSSVTLEGIPLSALHLTIPEQAPTPRYSDTLLTAPRRRRAQRAPDQARQPGGHARHRPHLVLPRLGQTVEAPEPFEQRALFRGP